MKIRLAYTIPLLLSLLASTAAQAVEYSQLLADKSSLGFSYRQMNVPMEGSFKRFKAQLAFDPAQPAKASAAFEIEVASIDVGSAEGNSEVSGKLWFNTATHPTARFVSSGIKALGNNRFEVAGKLTIKGKTLDVSTPVSFKADGTNGVFEGAFTIKRADYAIGEGMWADFGTVANDVQIKFRLLAAAKK
ncbi:YceI family protein [Uliginosibacterium sp. TH139]|uniref:YceI family protein n=1 Tax=Uliginosibacterium sp. TH139 TaxID=2067453 RepID=UPI000C7A5868|nr:YceI family protein [Uliginosibacterium sp. TH139]PLK47881.1 polyisoprenoid-binding protein [Uliginosibacterium sp. TH139]